MRKRYLLIFFLLILSNIGLGQQLKFVEEDGAITLYEKQMSPFSYQKENKSLNGQFPRANYVHPLYTLEGEVLTENFPEDHLHHRGIFLSWHQLYVKDKRIADPWFCEGIQWIVDSISTHTTHKFATLNAVVYWISTQNIDQDSVPDTVLQEQLKIRYSNTATNYYEVDFEIGLFPLMEEVKIGGSEDEKGYGGFSVRVKTPDDLQFFSEKSKLTPQNTPVKAGGWVDIRGSFTPNGKSGIIIMCEPDELESFQGWILRKKDSMQNPAFPGRNPMVVDKPLVFRNKIIVYQKDLTRKEIQSKYKAFLQGQ